MLSVASHQPPPPAPAVFPGSLCFPAEDTGGLKTGGHQLGFTPFVCKDFFIIFLVPHKVLGPEDRQGTKASQAGSRCVSAHRTV